MRPRALAALAALALSLLLLAAPGAVAARTSATAPPAPTSATATTAPTSAAAPPALTSATATTAPTAGTGPTAPPPTAADPNALTSPPTLTAPPVGHRLTAQQATAIADALPSIRRERRKYPGSYSSAFEKGTNRWQISYYRRAKPLKEIAQVTIDDATGRVLEAYTGYKVAWTMARGYAGAFGRKVNSPWIWITLSVLFVLPFLDPRRPWRMLHLDLLVLVGFGVSVAYFNDAQIDRSVPIVAPLLAYVLARMLWVGLRTRAEEDAPRRPLPLLVPASWLAIAVVFLIGFRIGLNATNSNVIDVGYAGVIGADRLTHGEKIYGHFPKDNEHGDTYGPVTYEAYVPFEQVAPWSGRWDDLPAAHLAAVTFDLLVILLLFLLGRQMRGPTMGVALAYGWAAFPFTLYASNSNSNDALVAVFLVAALLVARRPAARGAMVALGGLTKFATLALVPLFALHDRARTRTGGVVRFGLAFLAVGAVALAPVLLNGDSLHVMYERSIEYQARRDAPFSIWGLYGWHTAQHLWQAVAVALVLGLAVVPRRRDLVGLAACAAAIVVALQLGVTYWFYLYIVWFLPLVLVALLGRHEAPVR